MRISDLTALQAAVKKGSPREQGAQSIDELPGTGARSGAEKERLSGASGERAWDSSDSGSSRSSGSSNSDNSSSSKDDVDQEAEDGVVESTQGVTQATSKVSSV